MKIGIDAREFKAGRMTGIGRYLWQFLEYCLLNESRVNSAATNKFILFCNQNTWIPIEHPNLKNVIIPEYLTILWDQVFLPLYVLREKLDVFLTPYFKAPIFLSCPVVLIINDLIPLFFPEEHGIQKRLYFETMCAISARRAKKIITISEHSKHDIVRFFQVDDKKIEVVYLGVEERYKPQDSRVNSATTVVVRPASAGTPARQRYNLPYKYILYVGNLSPHKNVSGLIKSYAKLPANLREEYKLVLGASKSDKYYPDTAKLIEKLELTEEVIVTGFIIEEHLPVIYNSSSLFVFPSFYEGFGLPPLEAMACGVPVLASNASSIPEVVGDAAMLIGPEDIEEISSAIIKILTDENLRRSMIDKGLARAKQFTPEKMAQGFLKVLEAV